MDGQKAALPKGNWVMRPLRDDPNYALIMNLKPPKTTAPTTGYVCEPIPGRDDCSDGGD